MLKKTIKYVDYDGTEREEDFYFNLSKAELIEMQMSVNGGIDKYLKRIISEKDTVKIMKEFLKYIRNYKKEAILSIIFNRAVISESNALAEKYPP